MLKTQSIRAIDPEPPTDFVFERRISTGIKDLNVTIIPLGEPTDGSRPYDAKVWVIKDMWTTHRGSWEPNISDVWAVPQWARDDYLLPGNHPCYNDDGGSDRHILGSALEESYEHGNVSCQLKKDAVVMYWSDPRDVPYSSDVKVPVKTKSGWANVFMSDSSSYNPDFTHGPWRWMLEASATEIAKGAGMPWNNHVSFYAVWQCMTWLDYRRYVLGEDTPPIVPPDPTPPDNIFATVAYELKLIREILAKWSEHMGTPS